MPPHPPAAPRLCLLGGFELSAGGESVRVSRAGQRVLAVLAVAHRSRAAPRADLAARLWPDLSAERAASNLRSTLWRLPRPRSRALVVSTAVDVRLVDELDVDLWRAEDLARELSSRHLTPEGTLDDLDLLQLDLLPSWDDDWLVVEQESHRQQRLHALETSSDELCGTGRFTEALTAALGAVRSEPLRESAHRRIIEVHLAEGNHAEALRQYDSYRRLIAHELGLPPSPAIRRLVGPLLGRPVDA